MSYTQLVTPNPNISCIPGYCLQYVRQAFGLAARYPTATAAWEASTSQHPDRNYPDGMWAPVWYGLDREPAGHVVLLAPDGTVYSTSDNTTTPHHHPSLTDLEDYYAGWGWPLTYRGWTEDVAGFPVITSDGSINFQSITPTEEDPLTNFTFDDLVKAAAQGALKALETQVTDGEGVQTSALDVARIIRPLVHDVPNQVLKKEVPRGGADAGTGSTSLGGVVAYFDQSRLDIIKNGSPTVLNQTIKLTDGRVANVAAVLDELLTKASIAPITTAVVDVQALAAQLAPLLTANQAEQFMSAFKAQINK